MKNLLILLSVLFLLGSCNNKPETAENDTEATVEITLEELYANPYQYLDKEVSIAGLVTHVCKHGGQKLFIAGNDENSSIRIEVGKDITEFDTNMEGTEAEFKGIVKMMEQELKKGGEAEDHEHHAEEGGEEECAFEDNAKNYFIIASTFKSL
jgi:hypothetical protein